MITLFKNLTKAQRQVLVACFFAFFTNGTYTLMMGSMLPDMKLSYQLSDTVSGMLLSGHSIGNLIAGFVSGLVPLWLGKRKSIVALCLLATIGFAMMYVWGNPVWLIVAFVLTGIGRGSVSNFNNATVNKVSGGNPAASNLLHCFFAVGAFTAPMVFLVLNGMASWRLALIYVTVLSFTAVIGFSRMKLDDDMPDRKDKTQSTMVFLKNPSFLILAMMMFFYLCAEYAVNGWLVTYLQHKPALAQAFGTGDAQLQGIKTYSQSMATVLWIDILAGRLTCAFLSGKVKQKVLMLVSSIGVALFFAMLLMFNSVPLVTFSVMGLGFCMAGICPMIYSDASGFTNMYPMATSTLLAIGSAGSILMPTIVGATADAFGFGGGMSTILAAILLLLLFAILNITVKTRLPEGE